MSESLRRGENVFPGPPVVPFLRVGQGNLYSEAAGQMNCMMIPAIFLSLKDKGLLLIRPWQNSLNLVLGQNLPLVKPDQTLWWQNTGVLAGGE